MKKFVFTAIVVLFVIGNLHAQSLPSVSILGDSYSTFESYVQPDTNYVWYFPTPHPNTDVTSVRQTWWHRFILENHYRLCVNNSFSGSTICNTGYRQADYSDRSFITRMDNLGNPDILLIFGATNDCWAKAPIGDYQYAGWTKPDLYRFRPAMAYMLDYLTARYPNVAIYFLLNSELTPEINESVKTVCGHYGVECVELKGIDKKSGHPTVKGMGEIAEQVTVFLKGKI
jgi:hypothetical protein